jgi:hypothetical protein
MKAVFHPEARLELTEAARWYNGRSRGLGTDFRREVQAAVTRIKANPEGFGLLEGDVRCCLVNRFPYGILYEILPKQISIVAVMHLHRRPGYWRDRL